MVIVSNKHIIRKAQLLWAFIQESQSRNHPVIAKHSFTDREAKRKTSMLLWGGIYQNSTTLKYREKTSKIEMWSLKYDCALSGVKVYNDLILQRQKHQHHSQSWGGDSPS